MTDRPTTGRRPALFRTPNLLNTMASAAVLALAALAPQALAQDYACAAPGDVCLEPVEQGFALIEGGIPAPVYADGADDPGVLRAVSNLRDDLAKIGGWTGVLETEAEPIYPRVVVVGTLDGSDLIRTLVDAGKLDVSAIEGEWEAYTQVVVADPWPGVSQALVIAGSDKRGAIYGVYDLIDRAGVSPWSWWANVPVDRQDNLYIDPAPRTDMPAVKYRGIFLNDEDPALGGWANHTFGGLNADFYEHVFELILRLKGNYLWPAMWGKAIYDDDPRSGALADEMGIVLGTSHHEPLGRAHVEWERYGEHGAWNFATNADGLKAFWREGMERMKDYETLVTVGMRGDGDEAMSEGTAIDLLESVVAAQREIIADVTGKPAPERPQMWALYKEVQDYYDQGMEVPDDVTLLFADDNWGNIRRLPDLGAERPGGYGVYYHFDYVGGPRNYKWINTTQIERVWEQMHVAWEYGAREIWVVNVGDLKPMELPIDFFLDYAWDPDAMPLESVPGYTEDWAAQQFPAEFAGQIADLLDTYTKYNARRKPEMVDPTTFSILHFDEYHRITADWSELARRADILRAQLPEGYDAAYVQIVWYPIVASANLYEMYYAAALNDLYAEQGRALTNEMADAVEETFARDAELRSVYEDEIADGRWKYMMSQVHIGYTIWQQPPEQIMPAVTRIDVPEAPGLGVAIEGVRGNQRNTAARPTLPDTDVFSKAARSFEIYNTGTTPFEVAVTPGVDWVSAELSGATVEGQIAVDLVVDWDAAPAGRTIVPVKIDAPALKKAGQSVVYLPVFKPENWQDVSGFVETNGYVSLEAAAPSRTVDGDGVTWSVIPNLGRVADSITTYPVTAEPSEPGSSDAPRLEYDIWLFEGGDVDVTVTLAPTLDYWGEGGLAYALSIDDGEPVIVTVEEGERTTGDPHEPVWGAVVGRNASVMTTTLTVGEPGAHTLKLWRVDPAVVFQRVLVATGEVADSYLGPPVSSLVVAD